MSLSTEQLEAVLKKLTDFSSTTVDLIITMLKDGRVTDSAPVDEIAARLPEIMSALKANKKTSPQLMQWAHDTIKQTYAGEILTLVRPTNGF